MWLAKVLYRKENTCRCIVTRSTTLSKIMSLQPLRVIGLSLCQPKVSQLQFWLFLNLSRLYTTDLAQGSKMCKSIFAQKDCGLYISIGSKPEMLLKQKLTIFRLQVKMDYWIPIISQVLDNFIYRGLDFCLISSVQNEKSINQTIKYFPNTNLPQWVSSA